MTLTRLRAFLKAEKGANLIDIARYFETDTDSMQQILKHCERKGFLRCQSCTGGCLGCRGCPMEMLSVKYHWV